MGIYAKFVLPRVTHLSMAQAQLRPYRARVVGAAKGCVLDIRIGSARNLRFYSDAVEEVVGVDASPEMPGFSNEVGCCGPSAQGSLADSERTRYRERALRASWRSRRG
jgi:hypothetical protein